MKITSSISFYILQEMAIPTLVLASLCCPSSYQSARVISGLSSKGQGWFVVKEQTKIVRRHRNVRYTHTSRVVGIFITRLFCRISPVNVNINVNVKSNTWLTTTDLSSAVIHLQGWL